jgi:hypothetical protein
MYRFGLAEFGTIHCLDNNLKASNRGWINPINITLLGPFRRWKLPITFRSNRVKKATLKKIRITWIKQKIKNKLS